jgi:hypothetical protein
MNTLHVSNSIALGMATLVLTMVAKSTRNAFCTMTDKEVMKSIFGEEADSEQ